MTYTTVRSPDGLRHQPLHPGVLAAICVAAVALAHPVAKVWTDDPARPAPMAEAVETVDPVPAEVEPAAAVPQSTDGATAQAAVMMRIEPPVDKGSDLILQVGSAADLAAKFDALDYTFEAVREANVLVPRVFLASFPADLDEVESVEDRKHLFLNTMLPLILQVNEEVMHDRWRLLALRDRTGAGDALSGDELAWLTQLAERYRMDEVDLDGLLMRVDAVPPSMALAQSAVESGWGTSRFAIEGNAVFGQITFGDTGIVPHNRKPGETYMFAAFDRLLDGVRSYVHNLNTHAAYRDFRRMRATQREQGERLSGSKLLGGLLRYSELGQAYVDYVRGVIRTNDLHLIDRARLAVPGTTVLGAPTI